MPKFGNWTAKAVAAGTEFGTKDCANGVFNDAPPAVLPSRYWPDFKRAYRAANSHPYND